MAERMSPEGLRYAQAVAETGSFSAAARVYGITQPALSNGIAKLEDRLGGQLFTRSPRGVSPTAFGTAVMPLIDRALSALDAVSAEAKRWNAPAAEGIRMGVSPLINPALVARAYSALYALPAHEAPRQLVLREANLATLRESLTAGDLDIIVVPSVAPMPGYEHRVIDSEPLVLIAGEQADPGPAHLADLVRDQLILLPDTCGLTTFTRDLLQTHDLPMHAYPGEASSYRVLEEWPALGLGSSLLPVSKLTRTDVSPRQVLDEEEMPLEIFYEAVWDPTSVHAPDLSALTEQMSSAA